MSDTQLECYSNQTIVFDYSSRFLRTRITIIKILIIKYINNNYCMIALSVFKITRISSLFQQSFLE